MRKISELAGSRILVSDGAWGTFLHQKGLQPGGCPELWNVTHRGVVLDIARSYVAVGADMIETNSFGGSRLKLEKYGLGERAAELNRTAAEISREAAGDGVLVLGSVGPTGKMLIMEEASPEEMYEVFREQAMALEAGGADAIVAETMTDLDEAVLAVRAARENTRLEVICTMTFDKLITAEYRTMMGISPSDMVQPLLDAGATILGTNCGNGIAGMIPVVEEIRKCNRDIPILVHANAGIPYFRDGRTVFPEGPEEMASHVKALIKAGANIIGGCCGTTPEHIARIKQAVGGGRWL